MIIKSAEELQVLREGGKLLADILKKIALETKAGVKPQELNRLAESLILKCGGEAAFKGYKSKGSPPFPATLCVSANDEVVHGIPDDIPFANGEVIKLDIGMRWPAGKGFFTDTAVTVGIEEISPEAERLLRVTKEATFAGIKKARVGARVGDVSSAIQKILDRERIGIVRDLAGHGVGLAVHEEPLIPNFGQAGTGPEIAEGMVLAIEVMTTLGSGKIKLAEDGWTYKSADGTLGAHFEHTVVVMKEGAEILTK